MKGFMQTIVFLLLVVGIAGAVYGSPKLIGQPVEYTSQGKTFKGYLAFDESFEGKRPGVLVVHEWWGLNEYARKRAQMLGNSDMSPLLWICMEMAGLPLIPMMQVNSLRNL